MLRCAAVLSFAHGALAHGYMVKPAARQPDLPGFERGAPGVAAGKDSCIFKACGWFTDSTAIPGEPVICDKALITSHVKHPCGPRAGPGVNFSESDFTATTPWRSPGTAPVVSSCGTQHDGRRLGVNGTALPPSPTRVAWSRGTTVDVAESIAANHGGGYAYRLCPAGREPTEACFREHHLAFADDVTTVRFVNGSELAIPASRFTTDGREWTKNPVPMNGVPPEDIHIPHAKGVDTFAAPFPLKGLVDANNGGWLFSLVDRVVVPADLAPGDYTISWRWDCEGTIQVWTNCGDVTVLA